MVSDAFEEDPSGQQGYLQRLDVGPYSEFVPRVPSKAVRDRSRKQTIEIEEEPIHKLRMVRDTFRGAGRDSQERKRPVQLPMS